STGRNTTTLSRTSWRPTSARLRASHRRERDRSDSACRFSRLLKNAVPVNSHGRSTRSAAAPRGEMLESHRRLALELDRAREAEERRDGIEQPARRRRRIDADAAAHEGESIAVLS